MELFEKQEGWRFGLQCRWRTFWFLVLALGDCVCQCWNVKVDVLFPRFDRCTVPDYCCYVDCILLGTLLSTSLVMKTLKCGMSRICVISEHIISRVHRLACTVAVWLVVPYCTWSSQSYPPSPPLDNIRVMVIVWRLRGNIIRTALCCIVWHNVHSPHHTYVSSSYRSNRLALSHWDPYAVCRGGYLELYYCNMVEWFWWDSSLIYDDQLVSFSALTLLVWSSGL